ncbi:hypothetical protein DMN91_001363 [Ooceraea biroi]|uniref:Aminopeptidase N n=1 Tax=Ooceraea biroi TaxID=2015173 RepID=A0A3L8E6E1_OOCBI|nr:hypothetical protein DMN91_001363 [Ooceraea biroi]
MKIIQIFKDWRIMETFVTDIQMFSLHMDVAEKVEPIVLEVSNPKELFKRSILSNYRKAPAILRMLHHIITNEVFRNGLIKYLNTHQFSSASSDDLWNALQAALDESDVPHNEYRLKEVMDTWITQRHFPMIRVTRNYKTGETILTQEHFPLDDDKQIDDNKWWIPVTFTTQTNPDFTSTVPTHWLSPDQNITIDGIDPADWIIVNLQATGKVPPNLKKWTFCSGIRQANASTWNKVLDKYIEEEEVDILECLAYSEDPDIIINYLNISLSNDTLTLNGNQLFIVYYSILNMHADNELVLDYLLENIKRIAFGHPVTEDTFNNIITSVHSNDMLDKISKFAKTNFNDMYEKHVKDMINDRKSKLSNKFGSLWQNQLEDKGR